MSSKVERKLAAIMFTDIADFTALSAKDENKALDLLDKQTNILDSIINKFNGTLHKKVGDGMLYTFPTVTEAIKCAISIQKETKSVNDLNLRVGIHEGEISFKDGDVLGDDVNVASRIEAFAPIGGIAISGKVEQDISSLPEYLTQFIDSPNLKGVRQDVKIYAIISHSLPKPNISKISAKLEEEENPKTRLNVFALTGAVLTVLGVVFWFSVGVVGISFGGKQEVPSVGVMMMDNRGSTDDAFWVRGITEDLIIKVASSGNIRIPSIKEIVSVDISESWEKIANQLNVKYILTSSLYKDKDKFKLSSQLINTDTGVTEYANNWTESNDKVSTIVTTLAEQMLNIISPKTKFDKKETEVNSESYTYYMKGKSYAGKDSKYFDISDKNLELARELLSKAIALDSSNVDAQIQFARSHYYHGNHEIALPILEKLVKYCEKTNQGKLLGRAYRNMGNILFDRWARGPGDYATIPSLDYYNKAAKIAKKHDDMFGYRYAMGNIIGKFSTYYDSETSRDSAHFYADQMLELANKKNNIELEAWTYLDLATYYYQTGEYYDVLESGYYYKKAYELSLKLGTQIQSASLHGLFRIGFINMAFYDQMDYMQKIYDLSVKTKTDLGQLNAIYKLALVNMFPLTNYQKVEKLIEDGLLFKNKLASSSFAWYEWRLYNIEGQKYFIQGEYKKSLDSFMKAQKIFGTPPLPDYIIFNNNSTIGKGHYYLEEYKEAKIYLTTAIELMDLSNAIKEDPTIMSYYLLNELKLGSFSSIDGSLDSVFPSKPGKFRIKEITPQLISHLFKEDYMAAVQTYYNLFQIYDITGNTEQAKEYINISYNNVMEIASKLRRADRKKFLTKNKYISSIVSNWEEANK